MAWKAEKRVSESQGYCCKVPLLRPGASKPQAYFSDRYSPFGAGGLVRRTLVSIPQSGEDVGNPPIFPGFIPADVRFSVHRCINATWIFASQLKISLLIITWTSLMGAFRGPPLRNGGQTLAAQGSCSPPLWCYPPRSVSDGL